MAEREHELADWEYVCEKCGRLVDMDANPSPGEGRRTCADCYDEQSWDVPRRPGWQLLETPQAAVRFTVADFRRAAETTLQYASQRRDHIPPAVLDALDRALKAATEAQEAMPR